MLKLFRDNLKSFSWILWVVIATFIAGFTVLGSLGPPAGSGPNARAAWAGDAVVTMAEFQRQHRQLVETYRQRLGDSLSAEMVDGLRQQALDGALQGKLLALEARSMGLRISDDEVREVILDIPWIKDENGAFIGEELYRRNLRGIGYTSIADFEDTVRESLLNQKLNEVLRASVYVTDDEVEEAYRDEVEKAKVRYLTLPTAQAGNEVEVDEADLASYFEAHADDYRLPEQRTANYLLVDNARLRAEIQTDPAAVQAYYDQHPDEFTQEEQIRARHILLRTAERTEEEARAELAALKAQIEGGRDFAGAAREISEDPGSKDRGGDLSYFGRGRMNPAFEEAAFGAALNEVAGPVSTPFGVHLIQVTDRREGGLRPLSEVEPRIRGQLVNEQIETLAETRAAELLARLKEEETLTEELGAVIAQELPWVTFNTTQPFGRQDVIPGVGRSADFATATFDLEAGEMSALVKIPRGWAVLTLKEVAEPRLPELTEVEAQVRQAARTEKLKAAARARLEKARQEVEAGKTLDEVATELGLTVSESAEQGRGGSIRELGEIGSQVVEMALGMSAGELGGPLEQARGATLFEVVERRQWDPAEFGEEKEATRSRVEGQRFFQLLSSMIEKRRLELNAQYSSQVINVADADL